ncbi:TetR/AcrR family transcriptional regulator [Streptomyces sp. NPDC058676]|uniref:TetR/AcrR family transcriptional regulator n=1 Tax=unclassified Streptomyces TaxID=2593676 RepID=UPI003645FDE2
MKSARSGASDDAKPASRLERRKAQTRQKLIDAARAMLADDTARHASIQSITEAADVGFGSFYNHFSSKDELFEAAVDDVLEETGALFDQLSTDVDDPAAAFAQSVRLALRVNRSHPDMAKVLVRHGLSYIDSDHGLAPRALRDIRDGVAAGRFQVENTRLALATVAGSLLATLHLSLSDPELVDDRACDQVAEQLLRMLGLPADEARQLATTPLPDPDASRP